jgi:glycosyltransferase involved in cell wall biosynthesis
MKILVPLPFDVSCLRHGRNLRIVHLLRALARNHAIICAAADEAIARAAQHVLPGVEVMTAPVRPDRHQASAATLHGPWLLRRAADFFGYEPALHAWIDRLTDDADIAVGFDLPSALYLSQLAQTAEHRVPAVCDLIDDPYLTHRSADLLERWSVCGIKTAIAVHVLRDRLLSQLDALVAVAEPDAESLFKATGRPVRVVPNGVEIPSAATRHSSTCIDREPLVVFTGAMSFSPNERAACHLVRSIWPRVRQLVPQAQLALVGADPTPRVQDLARQPGVIVTGRVADIGEWLRRARVAVAPMLNGSGIKNKVLEACANACPVVATPRALAGIPAGHGNGILVADRPSAFAAHTAVLLADEKTAFDLGQAGQAMVRKRFSWTRVAEAFEAVLRVCVQRMHARNGTRYRHASTRVDAAERSEAVLAGKEAVHAGT